MGDICISLIASQLGKTDAQEQQETTGEKNEILMFWENYLYCNSLTSLSILCVTSAQTI